MQQRVILFLQSHPSTFGRDFAAELVRLGARCLKINFSVGDALFWRPAKAHAYRGRFAGWETWLRDFISRHGVTDIVYYGDRRPYHVVAAKVARELGIDACVYEFGYLRPDWITFERFGMGAFSHFPADPQLIRAIGARFEAPDMSPRYPYTKATELNHEMLYHFSTWLLPFAYPFYHADRYYNLLVEWLSGIPGSFTAQKNAERADALIDRVVGAGTPYYFFPLQLQNDYSLRDNARLSHQGDVIELVVRSFAEHAPPDTLLLFKQHPLDNGWEGWPKRVARTATAHGVGQRVHMLIGGNLDRLLLHARGCVLTNSTVGLHALRAGCPVKVLGRAVYDIEGLCHKGALDDFWRDPPPPDGETVAALVRALAGTIQVRGNFFTEEGRRAALPVMARMLLDNRINGAGAYVNPPPRLSSR